MVTVFKMITLLHFIFFCFLFHLVIFYLAISYLTLFYLNLSYLIFFQPKLLSKITCLSTI